MTTDAMTTISKFLATWTTEQLNEYRAWCAAGHFAYASCQCLIGFFGITHPLIVGQRTCGGGHLRSTRTHNQLAAEAEEAIYSVPYDWARSRLLVELIDKELSARMVPVLFPTVTKEVVNA